ncbi:MAG: hypothetical protein V4717_18280 [Bacteroidota bacterium]
MKKFTSLFIAAFLLIVTSASAQRVILQSNTNYEVQIDGRSYDATGQSTITDLPFGNHTVAVYQVVSRGIFGIGKKKSLVTSEQFNLGNNDVYINVSQNGQVRISQNGDNSNKKRDRNRDYDNSDNTNGRYGKSEGKGKGHKYGHYKNKNGKKNNGNHKQGRYDDDRD